MEVGAVKQAFNNEVILLKKKLNQARTQIIHKLTRKAKTLTEKKAPEHLKEKLKKKAESAVNEVLIMKKIKARDIAQFAIIHKDKLQAYLNKPQVDKDKACARLLLHKSLQDKYKFMRDRFGDVPIKDLFMSRQERRKLKQVQKEQQKNKKKGKDKKIVNTEDNWDVEDVVINSNNNESKIEIHEEDTEHSDDESIHGNLEMDVDNEQESNDEKQQSDVESGDEEQSDDQNDDKPESNDNNNDSDVEANVGKFVRLNSISENVDESNTIESKPSKSNQITIHNTVHNPELTKQINIKPKVIEKTKPQKTVDKKLKENKNKNLNEKLQNRNFKKDDASSKSTEKKIVDPFFITATGENYLSLAEPRQPDEVKEIHKQGNRKERRAVMFGHVPKIKPRKDHRQNFNNNFDKRNGNSENFEKRSFNKNVDDSSFKPRFNKSNDNYFNNKHSKFNDDNKFDKLHNKKVNNFNNGSEEKVEKLHPSWEAKKKQSSIVPFKGKKIVFDEG